MSIQILKTEIETDPLVKGYSQMTNEQVAESLNGKTISSFIPISGAALLRWSAGGATATLPARIIRINLAANKQAPFDAITFESQGYAAAAVAAIQAQLPLSYDEEAIRGMISHLAFAGVLTSSEVTELGTLGTALISRSEQLLLGTVKVGHVEQARAI